jgi:GTP cyclohydrolase I
VDSVTKKLQIQERIVKDIADVLDKYLKPKGVVVIADAIHLCMAIRGVKKQNVRMTNSEVRGIFRKDISARMEALELLKWR